MGVGQERHLERPAFQNATRDLCRSLVIGATSDRELIGWNTVDPKTDLSGLAIDARETISEVPATALQPKWQAHGALVGAPVGCKTIGIDLPSGLEAFEILMVARPEVEVDLGR
jgi:hypothetical protein